MLQLRSKETLDHGDRGWLKVRHHFVVSGDSNQANGALGALVVFNDDEITLGPASVVTLTRKWKTILISVSRRSHCRSRLRAPRRRFAGWSSAETTKWWRAFSQPDSHRGASLCAQAATSPFLDADTFGVRAGDG
jgi:hypothetical protein